MLSYLGPNSFFGKTMMVNIENNYPPSSLRIILSINTYIHIYMYMILFLYFRHFVVVKPKAVGEFVDIEHVGGKPLGTHPDAEARVAYV